MRFDSFENVLRALLVIKGDANAIARGKVGRRIGRRVYGKVSGRIAGRLFK